MSEIDHSTLMQAYWACHRSHKQAAAKLGVSRNVIRRAVDRYKKENPVVDETAPPPPPLLHTTERRLRDEVAKYKRACEVLAREANLSEDLRSSLFRLTSEKPVLPDWCGSMRGTASPFADVPVLFTSDFQYGEVVDLTLHKTNFRYDTEIAKRRYQTMIEKTIRLTESRSRTDYPGIVYVRGGDAISGDIHQELRETNEIQSIPSVMEVAGLEITGIKALAEHFGKVVVLSVPGNHGRTTVKPMSKTYAATNYDTLIAWIIEAHFKSAGDARVTFQTTMSGDIYTHIAGHPVLITHGDRLGVKGGDGMIGIVGPVARGFKKTRMQYGAMGMPISYILAGHFHTSLEVDSGCINGTTVGYSEYAQSWRFAPEPPSQTLLFFHPDWGVSQRTKVFVDPPESHRRISTLATFDQTG